MASTTHSTPRSPVPAEQAAGDHSPAQTLPMRGEAPSPAPTGGAAPSNEEKAMTAEPDRLAKLREPFPAHQISKLPKETKAQREEREHDRSKGVRCDICGGWHHKNAVHLDYVGHAALTARLLDTDPLWSWEPVAFGPNGLPAFDQSGGLWIRLTVCGVTRLGYGHAATKPNMDPGAREKEVIGDALRNAAMRFGAALDLWHKGDLHAEPAVETVAPAPLPKAKAREAFAALQKSLRACETYQQLMDWAADNAEAVAQQPKDWADELRAEWDSARKAARQAMTGANPFEVDEAA